MKVTLLDSIKRIQYEYKDKLKNIKSLPLITVRYRCLETLSKLAIDITRCNHFLGDLSIGQTKDLSAGILKCTDNLIKAETSEECLALMNEFFNTECTKFAGTMFIVDRDFTWYDDSAWFTHRDINQDAFKNIYNKTINEPHNKVINSLILDVEASAIPNEEIIELEVQKSLIFNFSNIKVKNFISSNDSHISFQELKDIKNYAEKFYKGDLSDFKIGNNFDFGFFFANDSASFKYRFHPHVGHLKNDGIQIILLAPKAITRANIEQMSNYMKNISVHIMGSKAECSSVEYVYYCFVGQKKLRYDPQIEEYNDILLQIIKNEYDSNIPKFNIGSPEDTEITFKSSSITEEDVIDLLNKKTIELSKMHQASTSSIFIPEDVDIRHPLIPFSPGQLGLVLVSGYIDGIVDEGDGYYHVIKGTCQKDDKENRYTDDNGNRILETTTSNITSVEAILADGTIVTLK